METENLQRADMLTPFLTPVAWQGAVSYAAPAPLASEYTAAAAGLLCDTETDVSMFAGVAEQPNDDTVSAENTSEQTEAVEEAQAEDIEETHADAMADVSVSLANMSVADTTATDDGKADKDDAQRDTSDDEESPEVVRVEQVVRGATRTRFGRQAKTISYAESSD